MTDYYRFMNIFFMSYVIGKCLDVDRKIDHKFVQGNHRSDQIEWHTIEGLYWTSTMFVVRPTRRHKNRVNVRQLPG